MKTLILLRHGKSSWADPELEDHDRPLAKRGRRAAPVIGEWLARRGHRPDTVLTSSSRRTLETLERVRTELPGLPEAIVDARLYHASPDAMLARLAELPSRAGAVLLVGHQPGLSAFARKLANGRVRPRCAGAFEHFPTAAAAVLELDIDDWSRIGWHGARFVDFARPRELMDEA